MKDGDVVMFVGDLAKYEPSAREYLAGTGHVCPNHFLAGDFPWRVAVTWKPEGWGTKHWKQLTLFHLPNDPELKGQKDLDNLAKQQGWKAAEA